MKKLVGILLVAAAVFALYCGFIMTFSSEAGTDASGMIAVGERFLSEEHYDEAVELFTKAIKVDSRNASAYVDRAAAYSALSEPEKAIADYNMATRLDPERAEVLQPLVDAWKAEKEAANQVEEVSAGDCKDTDYPVDAVMYNGHYYRIYDDVSVADYDQAEQYCESQNGYLATISSKEENDFLCAYLKQKNISSAYIGYSDAASEGNWKWRNGEKSSYSDWSAYEPRGEKENDDYAVLNYSYTNGTWTDDHFTDNRKIFICEWGSYRAIKQTSAEQSDPDKRNIVLVLDVSGSMDGTPLNGTKDAAKKFVQTTLQENANIAIVTFSDQAKIVSDFTSDEDSLLKNIANISCGGGTDTEVGLSKASSMLDNGGSKKKIIVLMSDGEPNEGKQGDDLVSYANEIKSGGTLLYTLGFFQNMGNEKSAAQTLMERLASDGCHYEVDSADDLISFFQDMADQINGQKYIYIRIACPVDVTVTYNDQTLSSSDKNRNLRTDFGTLTVEEDENTSSGSGSSSGYGSSGSSGTDTSKVKVLRLKEGADYDLNIAGTGKGIMDYTIGYMDENGDYNDMREFENVEINNRTAIDTKAQYSKESVLNIDKDGDGKVDLKLRAKVNGHGEEVKSHLKLYIMITVIVILFIVVLIWISARKRSKRRQ